MCRLLAFSFTENTNKQKRIDCISEFRKLANSGMVPKGIESGHKDGWGISLYTKGSELPFLYKSAYAADTDQSLILEDYITEEVFQSGLVHLRKKTVGEATRANSHPFVSGSYSFIHNGTVERGPGPYQELAPLCESVTDSERLFRHFLQLQEGKKTLPAYIEMLISTRDNYPTYSALNTMLHDGKCLYISRVINTNHPEYEALELGNYYTLYLGKNERGDIIVSSEKIECEDVSYVLLENNSVYVIDLEKGSQEIINL